MKYSTWNILEYTNWIMFLYLEDYLDLKNSLRWEALTTIEWGSQNLNSKLFCNIQCPVCQGHTFSLCLKHYSSRIHLWLARNQISDLLVALWKWAISDHLEITCLVLYENCHGQRKNLIFSISMQVAFLLAIHCLMHFTPSDCQSQWSRSFVTFNI